MEMVSQNQNNDNNYYLLNTWYTSRTMPRISYEFFNPHTNLRYLLFRTCYFPEVKKNNETGRG